MSVGYIGLERDHATAVARSYYCKLPALAGRHVFLVDPMLATGGSAVNAIEVGQFKTAIPLLEGVVARDERNADAYNWLGYAVRKDGDAARAIPIYQKALALDPKHRGAHEYIGEAYLMVGDLTSARQHLARLDSLCFFSCEEYRDLKKAIESFGRSGQAPTSQR